jgi:hypothetical protein
MFTVILTRPADVETGAGALFTLEFMIIIISVALILLNINFLKGGVSYEML